MDRVIEKKKWSAKKLYAIFGIALLVFLVVSSIYFTSGKSKLNVDGPPKAIPLLRQSMLILNG